MNLPFIDQIIYKFKYSTRLITSYLFSVSRKRQATNSASVAYIPLKCYDSNYADLAKVKEDMENLREMSEAK